MQTILKIKKCFIEELKLKSIEFKSAIAHCSSGESSI